MTRYRLTPGILARMGEPGTVLEPLEAANWQLYGNELGNHWAWSPGGLIRVGFQPEDDPYNRATWTVEVYRYPDDRDKVYAGHFSEETPAELVAAFVDQVRAAHPTAPDRRRQTPPSAIPTTSFHAVRPLAAAGWVDGSYPTGGIYQHHWSPDGLVNVLLAQGRNTAPAWGVFAYGDDDPPLQPTWQAGFDQTTPHRVAAGFFEALQTVHEHGLVRWYDEPPQTVPRVRIQPEPSR